MMVKLKTLHNRITKRLNAIKQREKSMQSFLNTTMVEMYRNIQKARWMSEGASERLRWKPLSTKPFFAFWEPKKSELRRFWQGGYVEYKRHKFAEYEGSGKKMLIATGKLYKDVIGPGGKFKKVATPKKLTITTSNEYANWVDENRTFTKYSPETRAAMRKATAQFLFKGIRQETRTLGKF